jgi:hypothetical protein
MEPAQPVKRSGHVALLLMGSLAVGGGAYTLMPGESCQPKGPGVAAPALPNGGAECLSHGGSSGGWRGSGGIWSRVGLFGDNAATGRSASGVAADPGAGGTTRGGFGSFARAFAFHMTGG